MTPWLRKLHKWVGLIVALQFVIWMGSGLTMSLLDHESVEGHRHRAPAPALRTWPADALTPHAALTHAGRSVQTLETMWLLDRPVYRLVHEAETWLADVKTGEIVVVDGATAAKIASRDYLGEGQPETPERLAQANQESRDHEGAVWRVDFSDDDGTTVYLSAQDGRILERRNTAWRVFDFVWMLHIMDYAGRKNFNNPLVVMAAAGGLWIALSGLWLLVASFRISEFLPPRWRPQRNIGLYAQDGTKLRLVKSRRGDSVYQALGRSGLHLPSNCGGGQSCGLCAVRVRGNAPHPTNADRSHLADGQIKLGYRLACNLPVRGNIDVEVAGGKELWEARNAKVERVVAVTPFLREITLRPATPVGGDFQPGAYIQMHVPGYALERHHIHHPEEHRREWEDLDLSPTLINKTDVRRSYSLSLPVEKADGCVTLLARFSAGPRVGKRHPVGKASAYLYSLKPGDTIRFSGPFGDFSLKPGDREKIFIGRGAGMAPLRAMIHARLDSGASERIHFWYGARRQQEAPYLQEMQDLAKSHINFTWHLVLSDESEPQDRSLHGLVHECASEHLLNSHTDLNKCEFYVCGPPGMLSATLRLLHQLGVDNHRIAFDDFKI